MFCVHTFDHPNPSLPVILLEEGMFFGAPRHTSSTSVFWKPRESCFRCVEIVEKSFGANEGLSDMFLNIVVFGFVVDKFCS